MSTAEYILKCYAGDSPVPLTTDKHSSESVCLH